MLLLRVIGIKRRNRSDGCHQTFEVLAGKRRGGVAAQDLMQMRGNQFDFVFHGVLCLMRFVNSPQRRANAAAQAVHNAAPGGDASTAIEVVGVVSRCQFTSGVRLIWRQHFCTQGQGIRVQGFVVGFK